MKSKFNRPGYLGPAFHEWLEWLEYVEAVRNGRPNKPLKRMPTIDSGLWIMEDGTDFSDLLGADATLARYVRASVKYRMSGQTVLDMTEKHKDALEYIRHNRVIHLPHEVCSVVFDCGVDGRDDVAFIAVMHETTTNDGRDYPELGVTGQDKWIDIRPALYFENVLHLMPVEFHMTCGVPWHEVKIVNAIAEGVQPSETASQLAVTMEEYIGAWLHSFHLASVIRSHSVGVKPSFSMSAPKKHRRKSKHPKFEHVVIEMPVDHVDVSAGTHSINQSKKRLHQVRGFCRHYKSGRVTWVKPHWRGDKKLGVIRKDYELTLEDIENE